MRSKGLTPLATSGRPLGGPGSDTRREHRTREECGVAPTTITLRDEGIPIGQSAATTLGSIDNRGKLIGWMRVSLLDP